MPTVAQTLQERLRDALAALELPSEDSVQVVPTADPRNGDYQTSIAMVLAKARRENPRALAGRIVVDGEGAEPALAISEGEKRARVHRRRVLARELGCCRDRQALCVRGLDEDENDTRDRGAQTAWSRAAQSHSCGDDSVNFGHAPTPGDGVKEMRTRSRRVHQRG